MLPAAHRMHRSADFSAAVRGGVRCGGPRLVVHHRAPEPHLDAAPSSQSPQTSQSPALIGLVVNRAVGGSVVRHRVARRLRAQLLPWAQRLPDGSRTVVRALPKSATATSAQLGADLERAFTRLIPAPAARP